LMGNQTYPTQDQTISIPPESSHVHLVRGSVLNLALLYVQEKTLYPLLYDRERYRVYLEETQRRSKWSGWKEETLVSRFPCLSLFVKEYKEEVLSKRNQVERQLLEEEKVEFKSLIQTKGRVITITGQFFGLMEAIAPKTTRTELSIEDLFSLKKIKVYLQMLEDLSREPCTIRNSILTLKYILNKFLKSITFQQHHQEIKETSDFLDRESARKKTQESNKVRPNAEDLVQTGHFMEEVEFSLFIMYLLQHTKHILEKKDKSTHVLFELQFHCYALMSLLDGGQRREVVARLQIDSLLRKESHFFLKKLIEKRGRGNAHEVPLLDISALLFLVWKRERKILLEKNGLKEDAVMSLWITEHFKPARPDVLMREMKKLLKQFNPCLQMTKLDLRRWRITSLFERMETQHSQLNQMDMDLVLVSNYLNTSLTCIRNHYNRHASQMQKGLTLLQPISGQMEDAFKEFQNSITVLSTEEPQENKRWKRYIRRALDQAVHEKEFQEWKDALERHRKENPSCPTFEELYERNGSKKRKNIHH
jgi:hypothetical protein